MVRTSAVLLTHDRIDLIGPLTVQMTKLTIDSLGDVALCVQIWRHIVTVQ